MSYKIDKIRKDKRLITYPYEEELKAEIQKVLLSMREGIIPITIMVLKAYPSSNKISEKSKPKKEKNRQKAKMLPHILSILNPLNHNSDKQLFPTKMIQLTDNVMSTWEILIRELIKGIDEGLASANIEEEGLYVSYDISSIKGRVTFDCDLGIRIGGIEHKEFIPKTKEDEKK